MHPEIPETIGVWLTQYGSFALFGLLALGILAFPIPEETLMVLSGVLMKKGCFPLVATMMAAYGGCMFGVTMSYCLGRGAGKYLAGRLKLAKKIEQLHGWFAKYGKWALFGGYFVPGVRHFTGFVAGMGRLGYSTFALFAYVGAFIWASIFLSIGYFFGKYWISLFHLVTTNLDDALSIVFLLVILYLWIKYHKATSS